ncbi:N-carbamoylputrescine amidase [Streptococcus suis]|uniref:N-carbamoylputrescine amidase n=1 Tax=Streptococcus suis TaxID=1307 RepID=A0A0Z8HVH9_STRSU|nr:N-carbamoylputrescine amidase [Streptococcus suis]CYV24063.1 N-carbamoylputrescine amidase [Streptococcus suis]
MKNQHQAPIYQGLVQLRRKRIVPFVVPGHKRGRGNPELVELLGERCVGIDVNSMKPYFCQERQYDYYNYAKSVKENDAIQHFIPIAKELQVVLPISFYEKDGNSLFNSIAVIDADGSVLGVYRKTHIPDDHYYQEKFYFTPGNTGFKVWETRYAKIGIGICWDQWFPETARCLALNGAELLFYPTAIGSEPILDTDSQGHWQRTMQGHAAANITPVIAANRIGLEKVQPSAENGGQSSSLCFYGSSFMTDETGEVIEKAG